MKKLESLRDHLLSLQDELPIDPDDLDTYATDGQVVSYPAGDNGHFELAYEAHVLVRNFSSDPSRLLLWVLIWMRQHLPDHAADALKFSADLLNDQSADIELLIRMKELVKVEDTSDGLRLIPCGTPLLDDGPLTASAWRLFVHHDGPGCGDPVASWLCAP